MNDFKPIAHRAAHCVVPAGLVHKPQPTRHFRAGLQVVPSLRDCRG